MIEYISCTASGRSSVINKVGKYLKHSIDGAFKIEFRPTECIVTMIMYYQLPDQPRTFDEMTFNISIVSYADKVRVNITENTSLEKTLCQVILSKEELKDLATAKKKILVKLKRAIESEYEDYEFLY